MDFHTLGEQVARQLLIGAALLCAGFGAMGFAIGGCSQGKSELPAAVNAIDAEVKSVKSQQIAVETELDSRTRKQDRKMAALEERAGSRAENMLARLLLLEEDQKSNAEQIGSDNVTLKDLLKRVERLEGRNAEDCR